MNIDQETLKKLFNYKNGALFWAISPHPKIKVGNRAGSADPKGYRILSINNKSYREHRIIFLYHYGYLPKIIDHIDRNPSNNRIDNLRSASLSLSNHNRCLKSSCKYRGITALKNGKYQSRIMKDGKRIYLGSFDNEIDASIAYENASKLIYG